MVAMELQILMRNNISSITSARVEMVDYFMIEDVCALGKYDIGAVLYR